MKKAFRSLCCVGLLLSLTSFVSAADQTWTGKISDSMCGVSHAKMAAAHPGADGFLSLTTTCVSGWSRGNGLDTD